jgi:osmotically-inducible protein OsmY
MKHSFVTALRRPLAALALGAALAASLQACVPLVVGAAAVGTMAAVDRRTIGAQTDDRSIELRGEGRAKRVTGDRGRVAVTSYNRTVLLTGEVADEKMKAEVEQQIATLDGVAGIENDLTIAPVSTLGARSNDLVITSKVKAAFVDTKDLYVNAFLVHTDRSVVYLLGRVTQREGKLAADVARNASGNIKKVVKLFEYISEDELQELQSKQAPAQPATKTPR